MSIATLKRKTQAAYDKSHSHGKYDTITSGFSINGARRNSNYIGKERLVSKVSAIIPESRVHEYEVVKHSVVDNREHMNKILWCCKDIVRTQSAFTLGSQELYIDTLSKANSACVTTKQMGPIDSSARTLNVQKKCASMVIPDYKLLKTIGTSRITHYGC